MGLPPEPLRVLLAIPCHGMVPHTAAMALATLQSHDAANRRRIRVVNVQNMPVVHWSRNAAVRLFLDWKDRDGKGLTHLLFMDADMSPPPNGLDMLAEVQEDIVAGLFTNRSFRTGVFIKPVLKRFSKGDRNILEDVPTGELPGDLEGLAARKTLAVDATGMAFTLIRRRVFEALKDPWFDFRPIPGHAPYQYGEDVWFCMCARRLGFKVVCRLDCVVPHDGLYQYDIHDAWFCAEAEAREKAGAETAERAEAAVVPAEVQA